MNDSTQAGVALQTKREEKEAVSDEDEQLFWRNGLLRQSTAKSLLIVFISIMGRFLV